MNKDTFFNAASKSWEAGNLQLAFELFEKAANLGDASSLVNLGYFYDKGIYIKKNWDKALYYYKKASALGDGSAANNIAIHYRSRHEYPKALWWFHRAARLSNHDVFLNIAQLYEKGHGVKKNPKIAAQFYKKTTFSKFVTEDSKEKAQKAFMKIK